ncbi:hypothetical protein [Nocardioides sp. GXZ039]|uniref:hypothetical protein n=1 Tax=Nocardioides sp. GXZ039 TaxID=3136018 RepID=UPI0030F44026
MEGEKFADLCTDYWNASHALEQAQKADDVARADNSGKELTQLQAARHDAWQKVSRFTGQIVRQTYYEHVHVLTAAAHSQDRGWVVPLATKLGDDLRSLGDNHDFITRGLWDESAPFVVALDAVSAGLGMLGRELAYGQLPPGGAGMPTTMWLDTRETMYERGPRTLPL